MMPADPEMAAVGTSVRYRNRWMTVREDVTVRADGVTGVYGVVEKADFALIVPYERGGFHLVEQYRYPVGGRYWEFPQGSWPDSPDADPMALARGELLEETGLSASTIRPFGYLYEAYGFCDQGFHMYLATGLTAGPPDLDEEEAGLICRWFSEKDVWRLVADGRIRDAPSVAALGILSRLKESAG